MYFAAVECIVKLAVAAAKLVGTALKPAEAQGAFEPLLASVIVKAGNRNARISEESSKCILAVRGPWGAVRNRRGPA